MTPDYYPRNTASPFVSTYPSRPGTLVWNEMRLPYCQISVRSVSPGNTGRTKRASMLAISSAR